MLVSATAISNRNRLILYLAPHREMMDHTLIGYHGTSTHRGSGYKDTACGIKEESQISRISQTVNIEERE